MALVVEDEIILGLVQLAELCGLKETSVLHATAGNRHSQQFVGAAENMSGARITQEPLLHVVLGVTQTAVHLETFVCSPPQRLATENLQDTRKMKQNVGFTDHLFMGIQK